MCKTKIFCVKTSVFEKYFQGLLSIEYEWFTFPSFERHVHRSFFHTAHLSAPGSPMGSDGGLYLVDALRTNKTLLSLNLRSVDPEHSSGPIFSQIDCPSRNLSIRNLFSEEKRFPAQFFWAACHVVHKEAKLTPQSFHGVSTPNCSFFAWFISFSLWPAEISATSLPSLGTLLPFYPFSTFTSPSSDCKIPYMILADVEALLRANGLLKATVGVVSCWKDRRW